MPNLLKLSEDVYKRQSFSITLRSGVRFSDGSALTAAATKTWIRHEIAFSGGAGAGYFASLTSIDVTGPLSLTLDFSAPTPELELIFSQVLEMGEIGSPNATSGKTLTATTDGAGEYMLDASKTVTGESYTYVPNPYYWDKSAVYWKTVVIKVITNPSTVLSALETGQVDVAEVQPITNAAAAKSDGLPFRFARPRSRETHVQPYHRALPRSGHGIGRRGLGVRHSGAPLHTCPA